MRTLVTGATGFVGRHLRRALEEGGVDVVGTSQASDSDIVLDVRDADGARRVFQELKPDNVVHLAAVAFVPAANKDPELADAVNVGGTENILDAAEAVGAKTLFVSTGAVYGVVPVDQLPIREEQPLLPKDAYAQSKKRAEALCEERAGRQHVVRARPFNHTGAGQMPEYVCSDFARQVAAAEAGLTEPRIEVGDLRAERDFSDVADVVRAYVDLLDRGRSGEAYNICSGSPTPISRVLDMLREGANVDVEVSVQQERLRPGEVSRAYGSFDKIREQVGWSPMIPLQETLAGLLADWRTRLAAEQGGGRA